MEHREPGRIGLQELVELVRKGDIDTVVTAFPDMFGRLMGKRVTGRYFVDHAAGDGIHACDYLLACDVEMDPVPGYTFASWATGYGDIHLVPDLGTLRLWPWLEKTAYVLCDVRRGDEDEAVAVAPREILRRQVTRLADAGFKAMTASELEFFVFRETYEEAARKRFHDLTPYSSYVEDYHVLQGTKEEFLVRAIRNGMEAAGIPIEFSKGEWGPGQQEINLRYADPIETADRHVLYKEGAKELAALHGVSLTFMAKWHEKHAGSSCHVHTSLWDLEGKTSRFFDPSAPRGMGKVFKSFLAGQLAHAKELMLFWAPFVNSYKRYHTATFAPTRLGWSIDNRTVGFRSVGRGDSLRFENRIPGADANPYLALAATIAAGLDGLEQGLEPSPPFSGDAYAAEGLDRVPDTMPAAIESLERSSFARRAFGDDVVDHYLHAARTELRKFNETVTCWERRRHFERT
ncbi:MAG: glutamine synthetase [Deltaproteobacteria bacterium]|nr:glutamine synthetase [Deltaproteobacteria bacterium]